MSPDGAAPSARARSTEPDGTAQRAPAPVLPVVALVGRPNSGKSSLYNRLTGGDAHVGNFPGITVDILETEVKLPAGATAIVADLPGLYSIETVLDPATDEGVARAFLARAKGAAQPLVVVQVIDSTQLALGLRLTRELARADLPLVIVATQRDVLEGEGRTLDAARIEAAVGVPVLSVSSRAAATREVVLRAVETRLRKDRDAPRARTDWDPDALARGAVEEPVAPSPEVERRRTFTARADAWLLHPLLGPVLFVGLMAALFAAVFLVADPATALLDACTAAARGGLTRAFGEGLLSSFLADGLLGGAGTVLAFMPQIVILTVAMELLEASGYLARGAFLVDRLLRLLGLSGRSFVPLLMGHACAVPAIAATRVIRDPRERLTTILVLPLMTCSARIPTYALVLSTFFGTRGVWFRAFLFVGLYFTGIFAALVASLAMRRTATKGRSLPLVLEMPHYRAPQLAVVLRKGTQAATRFLRDVGTSILAVAAVLWVLLTVPVPGSSPPAAAPDGATTTAPAPPIERSLAAAVGKALEPVTAPVGFDWRIDVGLIGSFGARELMVGTMGVIFGLEDAGDDPAPLSVKMREARLRDGSPAYSTRTGLALLAFFVFACQCMSTLVAIRKETRTWRWPAFVLGYTYVVAYAAAFVVYQTAGLLGVH